MLPSALALLVAATVIWAALPVPALNVAVPPASRPAPAPGALPWLTADGRRIVDDQRRTILLRGFNSDALLEYADRVPLPLTDDDAAAMASSGFDVVRLPIAWSLLEPDRGRFDSRYLDRIERTVTMLNAHGLWVIFDMHLLDWGPRFGGAGAPRWAYVRGIPDIHPWPSEPWGRHLSPAQNAAFTHFFTSDDWQNDYIAAWQHLAQRFRNVSGVAAYDLLNEPHPLPIPPNVFERHFLWPLYARTISGIGTVDPNHLFIVEGVLFGDSGTAISPLSARGLVYSQHAYTGSLVPPDFTGDGQALAAHLTEGDREAAKLGAPFWEGEFGIDHHQARSAAWADAALDALDDLDAGWAWWQWKEDSGWGIRDGHGHTDTTYLSHLSRPYVIAAPLGVSARRGSSAPRTLDIRLPEHASGTVQVAWPVVAGLGLPAASGCSGVTVEPLAVGRLTVAVGNSAGPCTLRLQNMG